MRTLSHPTRGAHLFTQSSAYEHLQGLAHVGESDGFRLFTDFEQAEVDELCAVQGGDRGRSFAECRNHQRVPCGIRSAAEIVVRRNLRGTMCDRTRVIRWLMLRKGLQVDEMKLCGGRQSPDHAEVTVRSITVPPGMFDP